ncbi:hypothetical protein BGS_1293 [Beggiatoa sp. SS]|nr:hypothetical protein BGS_1293 [Beggiatoa sp. SS]
MLKNPRIVPPWPILEWKRLNYKQKTLFEKKPSFFLVFSPRKNPFKALTRVFPKNLFPP